MGSYEPSAESELPAGQRAELERRQLVRHLEERRGVRSRVVLEAMAQVPRERFIGPALQHEAYADRALPIELDQTISQPYIVALMTELAEAGPGKRVLEIGTGCGYQTAVLAATGAEVYSIEILEPLASQAALRLRELGVQAQLHVGDGHQGLPEHAPFDAILVTAAPPEVPRVLVDQLALGGRLVVPVGREHDDQELVVVHRGPEGDVVDHVALVRFVPMTGSFC